MVDIVIAEAVRSAVGRAHKGSLALKRPDELAGEVIATVGGAFPAVLCAVTGSLALNWFFTPPLYTFTVAKGENAFALVVFIAVAVIISALVSQAARRRADAARATAEAEALARVTGGLVSGEDPLAGTLDRLRSDIASVWG